MLKNVLTKKSFPHPGALHALVECSVPLDSVATVPNLPAETLFAEIGDAGFSKSNLVEPLFLADYQIASHHEHLVLPHVLVDDIVIGILTNIGNNGWTIEVRRVFNSKLQHLHNLALPAVCSLEDSITSEPSSFIKRRAKVGDYVKGTPERRSFCWLFFLNRKKGRCKEFFF